MIFNPQGILVKDVDTLLSLIGSDYELKTKREYNGHDCDYIKYINLPCAFDIEVSSFKIGEVKCSCMYIWQFGINGFAIYGRTWEEFEKAMIKVVNHFQLDYYKRLPIYVHNLSYEFQFIRQHFEWLNIFAREERQPLKALTSVGIEYRCSLALSGCSLEQTCKGLTKYKTQKQVGDLDYELLRTPLTPLTKKELGYCLYDVYGVMNYIKEEMEKYDNDVTKLPMTKTGKVREACRKECFNKENGKGYRELMATLQINNIFEYDMLKRAFQGGFTHASFYNCYLTHLNVGSHDFTSSYPAVMVAEKYPMSTGTEYVIKDVEDLKKQSKVNCLIFNVHFENLRPKFKYEHYLSMSKCWKYNSDNKAVMFNDKTKGVKSDNGRVISADELYTTITNVDFEIIEKAYDFDAVHFGKGYKYRAGYLPTPFVKCILDFYEKKTTLKDVVGMEAEYALGKENVNSCYGMTVTDIINDMVEYSNDWSTRDGDKQKQLDDYNKSKKRFLFYPWGVFVTAYARRNLWTGILECGSDYIYSDTDSLKILNPEKHTEYFERYNKWILAKLTKACECHNISVDKVKPKTVKGKEKPLGVWDDEGTDTPEGHLYARRFKTLGAKRYLIEYWDGEAQKWKLKCTIAGVNKKKTSKWFNEDYENAFEKFTNLMTVPEEYSGRMISTYLDPEDTIEGDIVDYQGTPYHVEKNTGIHMSKSDYNLTMTDVYLAILSSKETVLAC